MTLKFKFIIDKETNFIYWAQLLLGKWSWYFEEKSSKIFREEIGGLSDDEKKALEDLKTTLQKESNQYLWLWKRYDNRCFDNNEEKEIYLLTRNLLNKKFELFWEKELSHLKRWENELDKFNFQKLTLVLNDISIFIGLSSNTTSEFHARVKLLISNDFPAGATRPDFEDLIILNVSRASIKDIFRVIGVITHEFVHILNNKNKLITDLIKVATIPPIKIEGGYKWKYLITEIIFKSIVSHRANTYIGKLLDFSEETKRLDEGLSHKMPLKSYSYEFLIRIAANRILPETTRYIDSKKVIDSKYINCVIKILTDLLSERAVGK